MSRAPKRISDKAAEEILRTHKKSHTKRSHANAARIISDNTVFDRVYSVDDLTLIIIKNRIPPSRIGNVTSWMVQERFIERVSRGRYRKLRDFEG